MPTEQLLNSNTNAGVVADSVLDGLSVSGNQAGYNSNVELTTIVGNLINVVLGLTGMGLVILLVYAGILYLTSQGDETNVKKAKKLISSSIIGILIIIASYAIAKYVFSVLTTATSA